MTDLRQRAPVGGLSDVGGEVICLDDEGVVEEGVDEGLVGGGGGSGGGYYYYDDGSEDTSESETTSDEEEDDGCGGRGGCGGCWEEDECCFEMVECCAGGFGCQAGGVRGSCGIGFGCEDGGRMAPRECGGKRGKKWSACEKGKKCKTCEKRRKKKKGKGLWSKLYPVKKLGEWGGDVVGVSRCPGEQDPKKWGFKVDDKLRGSRGCLSALTNTMTRHDCTSTGSCGDLRWPYTVTEPRRGGREQRDISRHGPRRHHHDGAGGGDSGQRYKEVFSPSRGGWLLFPVEQYDAPRPRPRPPPPPRRSRTRDEEWSRPRNEARSRFRDGGRYFRERVRHVYVRREGDDGRWRGERGRSRSRSLTRSRSRTVSRDRSRSRSRSVRRGVSGDRRDGYHMHGGRGDEGVRLEGELGGGVGLKGRRGDERGIDRGGGYHHDQRCGDDRGRGSVEPGGRRRARSWERRSDVSERVGEMDDRSQGSSYALGETAVARRDEVVKAVRFQGHPRS